MSMTVMGRDVLSLVSEMFADGADIDGPKILRIECLNVRQDDLSDMQQADFFWHIIDWAGKQLSRHDELKIGWRNGFREGSIPSAPQ